MVDERAAEKQQTVSRLRKHIRCCGGCQHKRSTGSSDRRLA